MPRLLGQYLPINLLRRRQMPGLMVLKRQFKSLLNRQLRHVNPRNQGKTPSWIRVISRSGRGFEPPSSRHFDGFAQTLMRWNRMRRNETVI